MKYFYSFSLLLLSQALFSQTAPSPLPNAHAHNDYEHERPLFEALSHGFTSVEADVHLINGELYVAHDHPSDLSQTPTLKALYLDPLARWVEQHEGQVYTDYDAPFYLMIDVKTKAVPTYEALKKLLLPYRTILHHYENGVLQPGPILIFLSGNRAIELAQQENLRLVGMDGRPSDIGKGYSSDFMPVISDNYRKHLSWRGKKKNKKPAELEALKKWIAEAHEEGKKVRLWATPERKKVWRVLLEAGVDFLNTDQLSELQGFLIKKR